MPITIHGSCRSSTHDCRINNSLTLAVFGVINCVGQDWQAGPLGGGPGNVVTGTEYLGCAAGSTQALRLTTIPDLHILFRTSNVLRMRLNPTTPLQTINGYNNVNVDGFLGLGPFSTVPVSQPFTMLHLDDGGLQDTGFRPWMRQGLTCTHNSDLSYFGMKAESDVNTHTVVTWADNTIDEFGADRLKFIFAGRPAAGGTAALDDGLEAARFTPAAGGNETFFGVGDWFTPDLDPTERVDLLNGRLRIRDLPTDDPGEELTKFLVVDDLDPLSDEYGVVKWRTLPSITGDCDWIVQTPEPHVSSVYAPSACNWGMQHGVGIGLPVPKTKLGVYHTDDGLLTPTAISGDARFDYENLTEVVGVQGLARATNSQIHSMRTKGVVGYAEGARSMMGVAGFARTLPGTTGGASDVTGVHGSATMSNQASATASTVRGVAGHADAQFQAPQAIGVYGRGQGANSINGSWGGYFEGRGFLGATAWTYSDEDLKQGIEEMMTTSALQQIMQLQPKHYSYNTSAYPYLALPEGPQIGLLSQQVEQVLPELVMDIDRPEVLDSLGQVVEPALTFKAMNYDGLIPVLIAAVQEQQARIAEQDDRLAQLEEALAACCASPNDDGTRMLITNDGTVSGNERALTIRPNPFSEPPTVFYTLERTGRMQLIANSANGKQLDVLRDATHEAGDYQLQWDTNSLQPGMYYLTLLLDGEPIVKKAVKVQR